MLSARRFVVRRRAKYCCGSARLYTRGCGSGWAGWFGSTEGHIIHASAAVSGAKSVRLCSLFKDLLTTSCPRLCNKGTDTWNKNAPQKAPFTPRGWAQLVAWWLTTLEGWVCWVGSTGNGASTVTMGATNQLTRPVVQPSKDEDVARKRTPEAPTKSIRIHL